jgi:hypothetical protein
MARTDPRISLSTSALTYAVSTTLISLVSSALLQRKAARLWDWTPPNSVALIRGRASARRNGE